jgi:hypothetical protein
MRSALFLAVGLVTACKGDPFRPDAGDEMMIDAYKPPWFFPAPGEVKNWDIQVNAPYTLTPRPMVIVNIWDITPATTITYDDASTVPVPAGSQNGMFAALKAGGKVICHVGTGAMRLDDPDAMKFPGYEATPPDRPTPVAANSAIGWSTTVADAEERFVDFRNATAAAVLLKRVKLAKDIGCDGILAYRNDASAFGPTEPLQHGFSEITSMVETEWIVKVAKAGHDLMISVGGLGGHADPSVGEIDDDYDWIMAERCGEAGDCDAARPFIEQHRAVFGLDYDFAEDGVTPNALATICTKWVNGQVDGVMKKTTLDGSYREVCP